MPCNGVGGRAGVVAVTALVAASPPLTNFTSTLCPSIATTTGSFLSQLPVLTPHITSLDVSGCWGLCGDDLAQLLDQMTGLQRLVLDGIEEVITMRYIVIQRLLLLLLLHAVGQGQGLLFVPINLLVNHPINQHDVCMCVVLCRVPWHTMQVDAKVLSAASRAQGLRSLSLAFCRQVDDAALAALAASADGSGSSSSTINGLQELVLDDCSSVSDAGLLALVDGRDGCRSLHRLSLGHCSKLTDASLVPLAERGVLEALSLNSLHQVGPATLHALARNCGDVLRELDVSYCRGITEGSLGALVDRCSKLQKLCVYSCTQLTQRFLHGHSREELVVLGVPTSCL